MIKALDVKFDDPDMAPRIALAKEEYSNFFAPFMNPLRLTAFSWGYAMAFNELKHESRQLESEVARLRAAISHEIATRERMQALAMDPIVQRERYARPVIQIDLSPEVLSLGAVRDLLIEKGWTPPEES